MKNLIVALVFLSTFNSAVFARGASFTENECYELVSHAQAIRSMRSIGVSYQATVNTLADLISDGEIPVKFAPKVFSFAEYIYTKGHIIDKTFGKYDNNGPNDRRFMAGMLKYCRERRAE